MLIGQLQLTYHFSGNAGRAQDGGMTAALVRELGDNYGLYHDELVAALADVGGRPDRTRFGSKRSFVDAWARVQSIVEGEAVLRLCAGYRRYGKPLNGSLLSEVPLVDSSDHLVDITNPLDVGDRKQDSDAPFVLP